MSNNPYDPWKINPSDFPSHGTKSEQLGFLVRYAVLAPSSHNTQPWLFEIHSDHIDVKINPQRKLNHSDPDDRQLYVSIGAAIENIYLAGLSHGLELAIDYSIQKFRVATLTMRKKSADNTPDWHSAIANRLTYRLPFKTLPIDNKTRNKVAAAGIGQAQIKLFTKSQDKHKIAHIVHSATSSTIADPRFRQELVQWVRHNWTREGTGMPGFVQGMPGPVSLLAKYIIPRVNIGKQQAKKDKKLITDSPAVILIGAKDDNPSSWLDCGRSYELISLIAVASGYRTSGFAAAIESAQHRELLQTALKLSYRPVAVLRIGLPRKKARHAPRQAASEVSAIKKSR